SEREEVVCAAVERALDSSNDSAILRCASLVDELGIALYGLSKFRRATATVRESVCDHLCPIQSYGLQNDHVRMMRQHRDEDVWEQVINVCEQPLYPTILWRDLG